MFDFGDKSFFQGHVTLSRSFTPWGELLDQTGAGDGTWGYLGGVLDAATGLIYVGDGQYYDPATGRFLSRGVNPGAVNPYVPWQGDPLGMLIGPLALVAVFGGKRKNGKGSQFLVLLLVVMVVSVSITESISAKEYDNPGSIYPHWPPNSPIDPEPTETGGKGNYHRVPDAPSDTLSRCTTAPNSTFKNSTLQNLSGNEVCTDDGYCGDINSSNYWNTVIMDLSSSYGITFLGEWSRKDKLSALTGVIVVAGALSNYSGLSAADTFTGVFGRMTFSVTIGGGNKWSGERVFDGVSFTSGRAGLDPRLMAHELAHAFNAMYVNGGHDNSPYSVLGNSSIRDSEGNWITGLRYDPVEGVTEWIRGYIGYRTAPNGLYDDPALYHGPVDWEDANSIGEEFADMFMNWAYNSFDTNIAGVARYRWMSAEVQRALSVMLPMARYHVAQME